MPRAITHQRGIGRVALVEFSDYQCPFCARHARSTAVTIKTQLLDSGSIRHVFFNFPLEVHSRAELAAYAAECAGAQGRFWEMHDLLFMDPNFLEPSDLARYAKQLDLDTSSFHGCLDSNATADRVHSDVVEGQRLGVYATPSFFIGKVDSVGAIELFQRIDGAVPFEHFEKAVLELLSRQAVSPRPLLQLGPHALQ
jgi:protein-disulfide isomerase